MGVIGATSPHDEHEVVLGVEVVAAKVNVLILATVEDRRVHDDDLRDGECLDPDTVGDHRS
jgi:hypothetical protein